MSENSDAVTLGQEIYDGDGNKVGTIRGFDQDGFFVTTREGITSLSIQHDPGQEFGEGYIMWRCSNCGEMGELEDGMPDRCPNCEAPKEDIYYWTED